MILDESSVKVKDGSKGEEGMVEEEGYFKYERFKGSFDF